MSFRYPFPFMKVGDRFEVPDGCDQRVRSACIGYRKWHPEYDFSVRREPDGKTYCERIEPRFRAEVKILIAADQPALDPAKERRFGDYGRSEVGQLRAGEWFVIEDYKVEQIRDQAIGMHDRYGGDYSLFRDGDRTVCLCTKTPRD